VGEDGERPSGVSQDHGDVRVSEEPPGIDCVHHGAGGVEGELDHRARTAACRGIKARRLHGVDEDGRASPIQLREHRVECGVSEVCAVVVGDQDEPVRVEVVERMVDLGEGGVGLAQRQGRQQPEPGGLFGHDLGAVVVGCPCLRCGQVARNRQQLYSDSPRIHELDGFLWTPGARRRGKKV